MSAQSSDYGSEIRKLWRCIAQLEREVIDLTNSSIAVVPSKAAADSLASTLTFPKIIEVTADETQGGEQATYYFNGNIIQEILLV